MAWRITLFLAATVAAAAAAQTVGPPASRPAEPTPQTPAPATPASPSPEILAARAAIAEGRAALAEGRMQEGAAAFRRALAAPPGLEGDAAAAEASRRLGFLALEAQIPRDAEMWYRAEAILSRRLFEQGRLSAVRFAEALNRLASALGVQGRSEESAQLLGYGAEVRDRARAAASMPILRRPVAEDEAIALNIRLPQAPATCLVTSEPLLAARMTCQDDQILRNEALISDARRIKADAPPPETEAEKNARRAREKAEARKKR